MWCVNVCAYLGHACWLVMLISMAVTFSTSPRSFTLAPKHYRIFAISSARSLVEINNSGEKNRLLFLVSARKLKWAKAWQGRQWMIMLLIMVQLIETIRKGHRRRNVWGFMEIWFALVGFGVPLEFTVCWGFGISLFQPLTKFTGKFTNSSFPTFHS